MENNEFKNIWKENINNLFVNYSKDELNHILLFQARKSIRGLYPFEILSVVCGIFTFFLIMASISHANDIPYVINNILLIIIIMFAVVSSIWSYKKMNHYSTDESLKEWLKFRINSIEKSFNHLIGYFILPIVIILTNISTFVYLQDSSFIETVISFNFGISLLITLIVVTPICIFMQRQKQKIHTKTIEKLHNLYNQINK